MGERPDWHEVITAARYLGCNPWDLDGPDARPDGRYWKDWALASMDAEAEGLKPPEKMK